MGNGQWAMAEPSRKESEMVIGSLCIEGGEMFAFEAEEGCFVRVKVNRDGNVQSLDFPIAHGTFDLIKKKFGDTASQRDCDSVALRGSPC